MTFSPCDYCGGAAMYRIERYTRPGLIARLLGRPRRRVVCDVCVVHRLDAIADEIRGRHRRKTVDDLISEAIGSAHTTAQGTERL